MISVNGRKREFARSSNAVCHILIPSIFPPCIDMYEYSCLPWMYEHFIAVLQFFRSYNNFFLNICTVCSNHGMVEE